jgi:hypothetical protein
MSAEAQAADSGTKRMKSILGARSSSPERGMASLTAALQAMAKGDGVAGDDVYAAIDAVRGSLGSLRRRISNVNTKDARRDTVVQELDGLDQALAQTVTALQAGLTQGGVDMIAAASSAAAGDAATIRSIQRRLH